MIKIITEKMCMYILYVYICIWAYRETLTTISVLSVCQPFLSMQAKSPIDLTNFIS